MTTKTKQMMLKVAIYVVSIAIVIYYVYDPGVPVLVMIGAALNPINLVGLLLSPISLLLIIVLVGLITYSNFLKSHQQYLWNQSHDHNLASADITAPVVTRKPVEIAITHDQYEQFQDQKTLEIVTEADNVRKLDIGSPCLLRHVDDYGTFLQAHVTEIDKQSDKIKLEL